MKSTKIFLMVLFAVLMIPFWTETVFCAEIVQGTDLHEVDSKYFYHKDKLVDSYGNSYIGNILIFDATFGGYTTYDLYGEYKRMTGAFVASDETKSDANISFAIFADGKEVFSVTDYTRQQPKKEFDIDLTGVKRIDIKSSDPGGIVSRGWLCMVDSQFEKANDDYVDVKNWQSIRDCVAIDSSSEFKAEVELVKDAYGHLHDGALIFNLHWWGENDEYVLYNLDKKFETFSGGIVVGESANNEGIVNVKIFCDDKEVFSKEGLSKTSPLVDFSIDVTDVSVLKIDINGDAIGNVFLTDDILATHNHTTGEWEIEKDATCTKTGSKVKKCTECGEVVVQEQIAATGHKDDGIWEIVKEATCTKDGEEVQHCTICGEKTKNQAIKKTGHEFGAWTKYSGSVWNSPIVTMRTCAVCGEVEYNEDYSSAWVKPAVIGGIVVLIGLIISIPIIVKKRAS